MPTLKTRRTVEEVELDERIFEAMQILWGAGPTGFPIMSKLCQGESFGTTLPTMQSTNKAGVEGVYRLRSALDNHMSGLWQEYVLR